MGHLMTRTDGGKIQMVKCVWMCPVSSYIVPSSPVIVP